MFDINEDEVALGAPEDVCGQISHGTSYLCRGGTTADLDGRVAVDHERTAAATCCEPPPGCYWRVRGL